MGAVLYCIRHYEEREAHEIDIRAAGISPDVRRIYQAGYQKVLEKVREAQNSYNQIVVDFNSYGNRAYVDTFVEGVKSFFLYYDPRFHPQDHLLTLDYPILCPLEHLNGIDRVEKYIRCVGLEQEFLHCIPECYIYYLLKEQDFGYEDLLINIAAIVIRNILGSRMAGHRIEPQRYSGEEKEHVEVFVGERSEEAMAAELGGWIEEFIISQDGSAELTQYLKLDMRNFSYELKNAARHQCLSRVLVM